MKGKRNIYLLLILVLVVWGLIGYRILSTLNPDEEQVLDAVGVNSKVINVFKEKDTFSIKASYRDPFLDKFVNKKQQKSTVKRKVKPKIVVPEISLRYTGTLGGVNTVDRIFYVYIEGVQYLMKLGDEIKGVKLIKGNAKEITIRNKRKSRTILIDR